MGIVLLVEDNALLRETIKAYFEEIGFRVVEAQNGYEAISLTKNQSFDLVVSDVEMPKKNGVEFLKEFRSFNADTPVVMMSGGSLFAENEILRLGANKFVSKPFSNMRDLVLLDTTAA